MSRIKSPKIDKRRFDDLLNTLKQMAPHYTPQWQGITGNDSGFALLKIFSYITGQVISRLNQVPGKNLAAFLDMLGIRLLSAQPARVPLTFKLAPGTEKEVLIPARTQAAAGAGDEHDELPYETEENLLAIPAQLVKVISVVPGEDAIYVPPPGFLEGTLREKTSHTYTIISTGAEILATGDKKSRSNQVEEVENVTSQDVRHFQLDHVSDLKEGDILKIGTGDPVEHAVIAGISGTIVALTEKLTGSAPSGTHVEKSTLFPLFEGKNMQEHSLYLGQEDLFNIKNEAVFGINLSIRDDNGKPAAAEAPALIWEYWGKKEAAGEEEEDWYEFTLNENPGFQNGTIELIKNDRNEITGREVNGIKSRWIRCRVTELLTTNKIRKLPVLDNVVFTVESTGDDLRPDLAFNNEIPLDVTKTFHPFGKEPRVFDTFALGGNEIFSKKGARLTLDIKVETRGIAASPAAVLLKDKSGKEKIAVFSRGPSGRLVETEIDPADEGEPVWTDHGFPPDTILAEGITPWALAYPDIQTGEDKKYSFISIFARAENGHLVERFYNKKKERWQWIDHGIPAENMTLKFNPAAVVLYETIKGNAMSDPQLVVFTAGSDDQLYKFVREPGREKAVGKWIPIEKPVKDPAGEKTHISITSSAFPESYIKKEIVKKGITIVDNNYPPEETIIKTHRIKVFFTGGDKGHLCELDCRAGDDETGNNENELTVYALPDTEVEVASRAFAKVYEVTKRHIDYFYYAKVYIKGSDGHLWEFDTGPKGSWKDLGIPPKEEEKEIWVDSAPHGVMQYDGDVLYDGSIFVKGSDDCLWEWDKRKCDEDNKKNNEEKGWRKYKPPGQTKLSFSPFAVSIKGNKKIRVFSASNKNSIIEWDTREEIWREYKNSDEEALTPALSWEYWNDKGWAALKDLKDETANFLKSGKIKFFLPENSGATEIAGQHNHWIRARIVGGDYGAETFTLAAGQGNVSDEQQLISTKKHIRPPVIMGLSVSYEIESEQYPSQCLTYNNLEYVNRSEECRTPGSSFAPFIKLEEQKRTLYLGFEKFFKSGPIKIFFDTGELEYNEEHKPEFQWNYSRKKDWEEMTCTDSSEALIRGGILEFSGNSDFSPQTICGFYRHWLQARLKKGDYLKNEEPQLRGIYPNTTYALQTKTYTDEILGSSSAVQNQSFTFLHVPVQAGRQVRVREMISPEEKETLIKNGGKDAVVEIKDEKGNVKENWVLWSNVPDFFDSNEKARHYTLDPAEGILCFGDGIHGMIPPAGENNIKAFSYQSGGGSAGNVKAGEIGSLKSAIAGVDSVINNTEADGGADTATLDRMLEIGPAVINHRQRAVTTEDFEWLAKQASRKVVKARCLPNTGNKMEKQVGRVAVIIVPASAEARPYPSPQLRRIVKQYLETHCCNMLPAAKHIHVTGPNYLEIGTAADIFVTSMAEAAPVEALIRKKLKVFFHPLTGAQEGEGWDFGRDVSASDVYTLLEESEGVDHVENLSFTVDHFPIQGDVVKIGENFLVCSGSHDITIKIKEGG